MSDDHTDRHQQHTHGGMSELLEHRHVPLGRLYASIAITLGGMVLEIVGGLLSGSLALLSDAGHMFTHVFALGISAFAVRLARAVLERPEEAVKPDFDEPRILETLEDVLSALGRFADG